MLGWHFCNSGLARPQDFDSLCTCGKFSGQGGKTIPMEGEIKEEMEATVGQNGAQK